jgi:hypothetical protein
MTRRFITVILSEYYYGGKIKGDVMGGARSTYGKNSKCISNFSLEARWEDET